MNATNNVLQTIVPHKSRGLQPKSATSPEAKIPSQIRKPVMPISVPYLKRPAHLCGVQASYRYCIILFTRFCTAAYMLAFLSSPFP